MVFTRDVQKEGDTRELSHGVKCQHSKSSGTAFSNRRQPTHHLRLIFLCDFSHHLMNKKLGQRAK